MDTTCHHVALTPDAHGYNVDNRRVMYISGTAHKRGIKAIPIIA
jgi:hypothetical protein